MASSTPATVAWTPDWSTATQRRDAEEGVDERPADAEAIGHHEGDEHGTPAAPRAVSDSPTCRRAR